MKKLLLVLFIILIVRVAIRANTITVSLDGSQDLTSIQLAVDCAADGDTILVHPGRYLEHVDIVDKSITVMSLYEFTGNPSDISNTIIDPNFQSNGFRVDEGADVSINGFLIENGVGWGNSHPYIYGGGISVFGSSICISNCVIQKCTSINTGGIGVYNESFAEFSSNIIRDNRALHQGGGIGASYGSTLYFDPDNLNSVYNNYGDVQDIYLFNSTSNNIA